MRKLTVAFMSLLLSLTVIGFLSAPVFTAETDEHPWDIDGGNGQGNGGTNPDTTIGGPGGDYPVVQALRSSGQTGDGLGLWFDVSFRVAGWYFSWTTEMPVKKSAATSAGERQTARAR